MNCKKREYDLVRQIGQRDERIDELEMDLGLMKIAFEHKAITLEKCEQALEDRDNLTKTLKTKLKQSQKALWDNEACLNRAMKYSLKKFRSGGFINQDCDMGRVYIDLPIRAANELQSELNKIAYCKEIGSDSTVGLDSCDDYKDWLNQ